MASVTLVHGNIVLDVWTGACLCPDVSHYAHAVQGEDSGLSCAPCLQESLEMTSTFKQQKFALVESGFDPCSISDPLFFLDCSEKSYVPLTSSVYDSIVSGQRKVHHRTIEKWLSSRRWADTLCSAVYLIRVHRELLIVSCRPCHLVNIVHIKEGNADMLRAGMRERSAVICAGINTAVWEIHSSDLTLKSMFVLNEGSTLWFGKLVLNTGTCCSVLRCTFTFGFRVCHTCFNATQFLRNFNLQSIFLYSCNVFLLIHEAITVLTSHLSACMYLNRCGIK